LDPEVQNLPWANFQSFLSCKTLFPHFSSMAHSKLQTSLGRIITFGPQFLARIIDQYEYLSLASNGYVAISGIFHDGLDPAFKYISVFGITCSD
jgi:hypothetical protein